VMLAALNQNYDVVEALLELGADPVLQPFMISRLTKNGEEVTGEVVESRPTRLSELAAQAEPGHPPDVNGMVAVLKTITGDAAAELKKRAERPGNTVEMLQDFRNEL
jgi:hypothetical protein